MAHRDDSGAGTGANNNASRTAALIGRTYAPTVDGARLNLPYTLLFLSTNGAGDGTLRAAEFAANLPERENATP
jgi:hypothetical protein